MDFGDLKKIIKKQIIDPLDHALLLNAEAGPGIAGQGEEPFTNIVLLPYQPTSENLLVDFAERIGQILPPQVRLHRMRLRETSTSYAEWFAEDN